MATEVVEATSGSRSPLALLAPPAPPVLGAAFSSHDTDPARRRMEMGGILVDQVDVAGAVERIHEFVRSGVPHQVVTVNLDFLSISARDAAFRATLNGVDLAVADGMPLVWLSRLLGQPLSQRVAGVELVTGSCELAAREGRAVFLLGAGPGVAQAAGNRLQVMDPGLRIAGTYSPPIGTLSRAHDARIVAMIQAARPDFLFVALGAPRQDLWIHEHLAELRVPVAMGVGCSFDLLAGSVKRAPVWMQRAGLEWSFRITQEPQRLWRRYLVNDLSTFLRLVWAGKSSKSMGAVAASS